MVTIANYKIGKLILMSEGKNFSWLNKRRVVYIQYPTDKPTQSFPWGWYYENGTYQYYNLFNSDAKINTIKSMYWHLSVLRYLNQGMSEDHFIKLAYIISDKANNFSSLSINQDLLLNLARGIYVKKSNKAPRNKLRKVIFKQGVGLEKHEKLKIVGELIGKSKKTTPEDIYQAMLLINESKKKITIERLSKVLSCNKRTIYRHMSDQLTQEKAILNQSL
jgi:hypothetical protein